MTIITFESKAYKMQLEGIYKYLKALYEEDKEKERKKPYTIKEACKLLEVSPRKLQDWRNEGVISFTQIKNKIYFRQEDIDQMLEKYSVKNLVK
ncbi:DNA binding domain-containing protein, excisionase family [Catalinimonas alkaloidigena]|uniref:DNA binding domain-containing protein, excisionase family n=1 Tax=Catalinimonas alkaloidigena TaxID=1075417 RepID=A0A1G9AFU8_9BACT|nr:helix-turn-helix domain-containing protein [Catalinimonas alkaloidigena]SDK25694.1 DNA binding domain-containing protein, excisionase family [Catalinimonas alkaloidigena]